MSYVMYININIKRLIYHLIRLKCVLLFSSNQTFINHLFGKLCLIPENQRPHVLNNILIDLCGVN